MEPNVLHHTLRLWARMIVSGNHESMTDSPQIPAITGIQPKRAKRESLGEALVEAASTIVYIYYKKLSVNPTLFRVCVRLFKYSTARVLAEVYFDTLAQGCAATLLI